MTARLHPTEVGLARCPVDGAPLQVVDLDSTEVLLCTSCLLRIAGLTIDMSGLGPMRTFVTEAVVLARADLGLPPGDDEVDQLVAAAPAARYLVARSPDLLPGLGRLTLQRWLLPTRYSDLADTPVAAALALDDLAQKYGMPGQDRITCRVHHGWIVCCPADHDSVHPTGP